MDSVEISLITCAPHEEIYSLYGHSALRYHDLRTGRDLALNYGIFDFKSPHFVLRFTFGLTDYRLGVLPFDLFCEEYRHWGSEVREQLLNLTAEEKLMVAYALNENLLPENRVYRYNFFYDNCSTRPRDIIENNIQAHVAYPNDADEHKASFRELIHEKNAHHPWAAFGNDLLLGLRADLPTTQRERQFLPERLWQDFEQATIEDGSGVRPLVKESRVIVQAGKQKPMADFPLTPMQCILMLAAVFLLVAYLECKRRRCFVWFDAAFMLILGLAGIIVTAMLFSLHPTTSTNLQVLLLNPLHLIYIYPVLRRKTDTRYWRIVIGLVCLFLIGSMFQDYAEGMEIVALCLLSRYWSHRKNDK